MSNDSFSTPTIDPNQPGYPDIYTPDPGGDFPNFPAFSSKSRPLSSTVQTPASTSQRSQCYCQFCSPPTTSTPAHPPAPSLPPGAAPLLALAPSPVPSDALSDIALSQTPTLIEPTPSSASGAPNPAFAPSSSTPSAAFGTPTPPPPQVHELFQNPSLRTHSILIPSQLLPNSLAGSQSQLFSILLFPQRRPQSRRRRFSWLLS